MSTENKNTDRHESVGVHCQVILRPMLCWIVSVMIKFDLFHNKKKFKPGDNLKYNWKAKVYIWSAIKNKLEPRTMTNYLYKDNTGILFENGESCDPFWVRKLHWWESK